MSCHKTKGIAIKEHYVEELTLRYGGADAVKQGSQGLATPLSGQRVHSEAHAACPQAAELQGRCLDSLTEQRLQPFAPCAGFATCAGDVQLMRLHNSELATRAVAENCKLAAIELS